MGYLLLEGGAEFGGRMTHADSRAMALAGGEDAVISIVPAAAAPDNNHRRAGSRGVAWFRRLGARRVHALPLIDRRSAGEPAVSEALRRSNLVFLLGGFPGYLADTLRESASWTAITHAGHSGGVIAGSSAGAMVLCAYYYDPYRREIRAGLNLIDNACLVPHHDTGGGKWVRHLQKQIPHAVVVGIDEETGMLNDGPEGAWNVYGGGAVTIYRAGYTVKRTAGQPFLLDCR
jgi:cyanophycinase